MLTARNPKAIAITAKEFIHCLLEPKASFPCGGEDPDFHWFEKKEPHINAVHFELQDKLEELRKWKKKALIRAFTQNSAFEEEKFWNGHFIKELLSEYYDYSVSHEAKALLLSHAFANQTVSDLVLAAELKSHHVLETSTDIRTMVDRLVTPQIIQKHVEYLLFYIRSIYPVPDNDKKQSVFLEGTDGSRTTKMAIKSHHDRIRQILTPTIDELALFLPAQSFTWHDLEMHKYPMEREADYTSWMWSRRFWSPG